MGSSVQSILEDLLQILIFKLFENVDSTTSDLCRSVLPGQNFKSFYNIIKKFR